MVFNLRDDELRIYKAEEPDCCHPFSGAIVSGPYNGFFVTDTAEEAPVMGVHFKQGGAFPFLGIAADELADTHIDLDRSGDDGRLRSATGYPRRDRLRRFRLLEKSLLSRLFRPWSIIQPCL
ncbi:MAG TPA: DUF6597 domain-containing transcriptional factor [Candidatus Sulfotelmatobacter sp.]|jgi:hypothetical protein|nr:DUF6597 domain-containing transcriptional factor [Candidatus Sulfotelmatobacter sp.]